jgi:hypothetical protein
VVGLVLLGGGAGALAATQLSSSNPRRAYFDDVAHRLHVSPAALMSAMKQGLIDQIGAAEKAGRLTAAQANEVESRLEHGPEPGGFGLGMLLRAQLFGRGRFGPRFDVRRPAFGMALFGLVPGAFAAARSAATSYLGITAAALRFDAVRGRSLAQIASATPGKSVAGLESALKAALGARLERAVAMGWMSSTHASELRAALPALLPMLVDRSYRAALLHYWVP